MNKKKNGFMNLLFEGFQHTNMTPKKAYHDPELKKLSEFVEQNVFMPRNKLKNMRIIRITDGSNVNAQGQEITKQLKKMFVDGSHLTELIPRRQLVTQNYRRTLEKDRMYSPQIRNRRERNSLALSRTIEGSSLSEVKDEKQKVELQNLQENSINLESKEFETVQIIKKQKQAKDDFVSVDCSTNSSSSKGFKHGKGFIRYRKIFSTDKKNERQSFEMKQATKKKQTLELKKELVKFYSNHFGNPQNISSKAYIVLQHFKDNKCQNLPKSLHVALNSKINLEIASLTKIMTCVLTLQLCQKYKINIKTKEITIGSFQTRIDGTSADLEVGQIYTVQQLLYGLMLPSGNDASIALSVFCGELIQNSKRDLKKSMEVSVQSRGKKQFYKNFILEMNKKSLTLDMKRTFFTNSHGLSNQLNKSCASDVAILIDYSLKNTMFRKVIGTQQYECQISIKQSSEQKSPRKTLQLPLKKQKVRWQNTHRFVHSKPELYKGIKTGITQIAGPCLASLVEYNKRQFIIVVLNSKTQKYRYKDTQNLRQWLFKKQEFVQEQSS